MATTNTTPSEHFEQRELVRWFRKVYAPTRIFAIPNGGARGAAAAGRLKSEGVSPGVPDLCIPAWGLWVEMKRQKGGALSAEQKDWIAYLRSVQQCVLVCRGADDAKAQIQNFLEEHPCHSPSDTKPPF